MYKPLNYQTLYSKSHQYMVSVRHNKLGQDDVQRQGIYENTPANF